MRILLYQWNSYLQYDIECICKEKNISLKSFSWDFKDKNMDEAKEPLWSFADSIASGSKNIFVMLSFLNHEDDFIRIS